MSTVSPGQVWADADIRAAGRTLRIDEVDGKIVVATILANSSDIQANLDAGEIYPLDRRGKTTVISLARFAQSNSRGYRLISQPEDAS
jgi:hypothetical protein